jgi:uroporphyrin-III C-methyltransferase/precorrin-2 dehydrogenase/sirohydrochlorin ferrochelatase
MQPAASAVVLGAAVAALVLTRSAARAAAAREAAAREAAAVREAAAAAAARRVTAPGTRRVVLVGAGPGAMDLISVRGLLLVKAADAIVYDRLVSPLLLREAKAGCLLVNVGKAPLKKRFRQSEINDILVSLATEGRLASGGAEALCAAGGGAAPTGWPVDGTAASALAPDALIVRLKGGDPFVFGLGGDEVLALAQVGQPSELVPGISSALAVPLSAGIPVTHKGASLSVTVISGHLPPGHPAAADWSRLPRGMATLVVLMGTKHIAAICDYLIAAGWPPSTPAAAVVSGTTAGERTLRATVQDLPALAQQHQVGSPAVLVFGDVVAALDPRWIVRAAAPPSEGALWGDAREAGGGDEDE